MEAGRTKLPKSGRVSQQFGRGLDAQQCLPFCFSRVLRYQVQIFSRFELEKATGLEGIPEIFSSVGKLGVVRS